MRRVLTGLNAKGRSCVLTIEELDPRLRHVIRETSSAELTGMTRGIPAESAATDVEPSPSGSKWAYYQVPPSVPTPAGAELRKGFDARGFHVTRTVDYIYVLEGEMYLDLEEESILVGPGDFIVQQATRHAWRNAGTRPVSMLGVLISADF